VICAFSWTAGAIMGRPRSRRRYRSGWLGSFYQVVSRVDEAACLRIGGFLWSQVELQVRPFNQPEGGIHEKLVANLADKTC
jgi:hypothetical protein